MTVPDFIALVTGITGVITAIGVLIANIQQNKRTTALLDYRMKKVEEKLDEHNGYAEKLNSIEIAIVAIQKDLEYIKAK